MQSWHTFFWAARFVISWLENFKAIVWSDQKFFDSPDKKHAMACKVCKNWAFQRNLLSSAHTQAHKKNPKREWFAIWFLGAELSSLSSIPKNQCKSALSFHSFSESFLHLWRERKNEAQWCVLKMKQNLYQTRGIFFFQKKKKEITYTITLVSW